MITFDKSNFTGIKYKSKEEIAKEISIKSKIDIDILLKDYNQQICSKYESILLDLVNKYLLSLSNTFGNTNVNKMTERGEFILEKEKNSYVLYLDSIRLEKFLIEKINRYLVKEWSTKKIEDDINLLPKIYKFLINKKKVRLTIHNKEFKTTYDLEIRKLNQPKLIETNVPTWDKTWIFSPDENGVKNSSGGEYWSISETEISNRRDNYLLKYLDTHKHSISLKSQLSLFKHLKNSDRTNFFIDFKEKFLSNRFYNLNGNLNYAFLLMYLILFSDIKNKSSHLYNLGLCYPEVSPYYKLSSLSGWDELKLELLNNI
jgi:hypothetical protein